MDSEALAGLAIIAQGPAWTLYRCPNVLLVRFHGDIDDDASAAWRAAAQKSIDSDGWPRFAFVEPTDGHATTSLSSRMRTAAFLRDTARHVETVTIVSDRMSTFVIKTILRAAGAGNVELVDSTLAPAHLARLRAL